MTDDDPLNGADIGDTVTVRETTDIWVGGLLDADATEGSDRLADSEVVATEVVTDEYGDQHLRVTVESDVTKRLPRRWDTAREPRTDSERRQARRDRWASRLARWLPIPVTLGLGLAITNRVMSELSGDVTINGAPLTYSPGEMLPAVLAVVAFAALIVWGIKYLPGGQYGGAR